jgi:hypothetical protein
VTRDDIYAAIDAERSRQHDLWHREHEWGFGDCSSVNLPAITKAAVLGEECGEVQRAVLDRDNSALARELVQVAAVAVAWLESMPSIGAAQYSLPGMGDPNIGRSACVATDGHSPMPGYGA